MTKPSSLLKPIWYYETCEDCIKLEVCTIHEAAMAWVDGYGEFFLTKTEAKQFDPFGNDPEEFIQELLKTIGRYCNQRNGGV